MFLSGRFQEALEAYLEGQRRDPERNLRQACRLAMVRFAAGDLEGADRDLWRAADAAPPEEREDLLLEAYEIAKAVLDAAPVPGPTTGVPGPAGSRYNGVMQDIHDRLAAKLGQRVDRRGFLRGSGLAAAAVVGVVALPGLAHAQDPSGASAGSAPKDGAPPADDPDDASKGKPEEDPFKVTKIDDDGKPYRLCPQCGYKMYKQDRTWTCENCGYSYDE